ncbi:MAG: DUF3000 domain-containing protein [Propionibacteriaceae bacterium]|nr:DUF3000 domain-containing protein [Propionibacteriaceae bacterium]
MGVRLEKTPQFFDSVVSAMKSMSWRAELVIEEIPAPSKIAPFSVAIEAELSLPDSGLSNGQLVLLYDPQGNESWDGEFRCVTFSRSDVDQEMVVDPLLVDVGWLWLLEALERNRACYSAPSGTVTAVSSKSHGAIGDQPRRSEIELRASWTPVIDHPLQITSHLQAWGELLCQTCGLPPLPEGVVPISRRIGTWSH